ncbi:hypothetical protein AAFF_G00077970 [Aldrovandia affinis]|uniref:Uncharacterized protein n=1 Tax=Aldrovandia affinis TaxID=143900 RepID=A0AAD7RXI6_9TELE|nr:hypothetical protein AAFF_G00077970 [Aldrovandia affinis]
MTDCFWKNISLGSDARRVLGHHEGAGIAASKQLIRSVTQEPSRQVIALSALRVVLKASQKRQRPPAGSIKPNLLRNTCLLSLRFSLREAAVTGRFNAMATEAALNV